MRQGDSILLEAGAWSQPSCGAGDRCIPGERYPWGVLDYCSSLRVIIALPLRFYDDLPKRPPKISGVLYASNVIRTSMASPRNWSVNFPAIGRSAKRHPIRAIRWDTQDHMKYESPPKQGLTLLHFILHTFCGHSMRTGHEHDVRMVNYHPVIIVSPAPRFANYYGVNYELDVSSCRSRSLDPPPCGVHIWTHEFRTT